MSRAFVKEMDDAPPPPPLERPVSLAPNFVTPRGAALIEAAVAALEGQLAAAPGEEAIALIRRDLRYWVARHATMRIVPADPAPGVVAFGARATIARGSVTSDIAIVGEDEADPPAGLIAWTAPLARALDGAEVGDVVDFEAGGRVEEIKVIAVTAP
ncbi:MAG: GreA/GreB family elongation factor [Pseudomonadota bacterium]|nr:GreA/GreB family elongation factor [Pseudomonadota bacterium]